MGTGSRKSSQQKHNRVIGTQKQKAHKMKVRIPKLQNSRLAAAMLVLTTVAPIWAGQGNLGNAGVLPPQSHAFGKSSGEWTVAWWQWALSIPAANNPLLDTTGAFASVGQMGPVWFLAGTFGNSAERSLVIPAGKGIFMPVHPWIFGSCAGDCNPSNPGVQCHVPTLRTAAATAATSATTLEVSIDGVPVNEVGRYRALSPDSFSVTLPDANVLQLFGLPTPAGEYAPQVSDGYWLMLKPLDVGNHTIRVHVVNSAFGVDSVVTSHITVTPN